MGWFESLSGSNKPEGARKASLAEQIERNRYFAHHSPLKSGESLQWEGHLFTGYHYRKVEAKPTEYIKFSE
jgi:hypothetical protein